MRGSALAQHTLLFHQQAQEEGRLLVTDLQASEVLSVLESGIPRLSPGCRPTEGQVIGIEVYRGQSVTPAAASIRRKVAALLENYSAFLWAAEQTEYTPQLIKAALQHYERLADEHIDTLAYSIKLDLDTAILQLPEHYRTVAALLQQGEGPKRIGERLGENGYRVVGETYVRISRILKGGKR